MIIKILVAVVAALGILAAYIASRPSSFRMERSAILPVPSEKVFPLINDLRLWEGWSPWAKLDPEQKLTYSGPEAGIGASVAWEGNSKVGAGRMTILESKPNELVRIKLEFFKPFKGLSTADFDLTPETGGTRVTWSMYGPQTFIGKAMSCFVDCDKMMGGTFEEGLSNLSAAAQRAPLPQ